MKKLFCIICGKYRSFEKREKNKLLRKKHYFFPLFAVSVKIKKKIFKEEESFEILKILGLFENIPNILKHTLIEYIYIYIYIYGRGF